MMTTLSSNRMIFEGQNSLTRGILDFISIYRKLVAKGSLLVDGFLWESSAKHQAGCSAIAVRPPWLALMIAF